jgi:hypothetical protein
MAVKKISELSKEDSAIGATDLMHVVVSGVNKKVEMSDHETLRKIIVGPAATTENSVPQWNATTRLLKDGLPLSTSVATPGVDTKLPTEQAARELANTLERWTPIATSKYTATPASSSQITMSDTTDLAVGMPIRYTDASGTFYGVVDAIVGNTSFDLNGAPFDVGDDLTALAVGQPEMLFPLNFFISGNYDGGVADLLDTIDGRAYRNLGPAMYLVHFAMQHKTDDTGANQPKLNVKVNAVAVSDADGGNGIQVGTAWVHNGLVNVDSAQYDLQNNEALEINLAVVGSNGDAEDLSVMMLFVRP